MRGDVFREAQGEAGDDDLRKRVRGSGQIDPAVLAAVPPERAGHGAAITAFFENETV